MGKVIVAAKMDNLNDLFLVSQGLQQPSAVRSVEVADALVDTRATFLSMPGRLIDQLGLVRYRTRRARTSGGMVEFGMYGMVHLTVQGRDANVEVAEVPDECPVLIGQVPLEILDWVVDPVNQRLIGNPDHGGEQMFDMF
jgi:predicted aspartyl protease